MGLKDFTSNTSDDQDTAGIGGVPAANFPPLPAQSGQEPAEDLLVNYNQRFAGSSATLFRDRLIEQTLSVLIGRNKPNALLVGPAGVGKTKIVEDIARRIASDDSLIPEQLRDHTIYELPISNLIAGSGVVGMLEEKVQSIVDFATDPKNKAIVFMDEIHQLTGGSHGKDASYSKIAQLLKPAMARGDMQIIGATTTQEARSLDGDPAFRRRFSRLVVDELSADQTLEVLDTIRPGLISHYSHQTGVGSQQIMVSDEVLASVVTIADQNSHAGSHRPDNAITLLDRAMADRVLEQKRLITTALESGDTATAQALESIAQVALTHKRVHGVAQRMLTGNTEDHAFAVEELSSSLKQQLVGQDDVLDQLIDRISREQLSVFPREAPLAWMFAGASGVGKTATAKIIAEQVTGQNPIVVNMSEYHHESSISRLIGSAPGYIGSDSNAELPFDSLESNPYRVILLDEFEKADKAVQRLFLQALDEGILTTSSGKMIDFSRSIIIATTNAARESLNGRCAGFGSGPAQISHQSLNRALEQFFDPELLGRFSLVVGFNPMSAQVYAQVIAARYRSERTRILANKPRYVPVLPETIPEEDVAEMVEASFVDTQGARPAQRVVRTWIEDRLLDQHRCPNPAPAEESVAEDQMAHRN